jgi:DNA modification methylase
VEWGSRGVWQIPSVRANNDHEAKFPVELPRRAIKLLTGPEDVVLDCFVGSGTTAVAAIREGRHFIGIELEKKYADLARLNVRRELVRHSLLPPEAVRRERPKTEQLRLLGA